MTSHPAAPTSHAHTVTPSPAPPPRLHSGRALALALSAFAVLAACRGKEEKAPPSVPREVPTYAARIIAVAHKESPQFLRKDRTKAEAKARAEEIARRCKANPASFAEEARQNSDDPRTAADGGFFGFMSEWTGELPQLVSALAALTEGGVSDAVEGPDGYTVLQRLSREDGKRIEAESVAVIEGLIAPWSPLDQGVDRTFTKETAYAAVAKAAVELRIGKITLAQALDEVKYARPMQDPVRRRVEAGYEALARAAFALGPDETSDPIETKGGWAVITRRPYFRTYLRQIIVAHQGSLVREPPPRTVEEAYKRAQEALEMVRKDRSAWREAVMAYSDEPASRPMAGYAGDVTNAGLPQRRHPPEVEQVLARMAPGEISEVIQTRLGFQILWRLD